MFVSESDTNTQPIAREIYAKIVELKNVRPYLLINNLHRYVENKTKLRNEKLVSRKFFCIKFGQHRILAIYLT